MLFLVGLPQRLAPGSATAPTLLFWFWIALLVLCITLANLGTYPGLLGHAENRSCCGHHLMDPPPNQAEFALGEGPSPRVLHLGQKWALWSRIWKIQILQACIPQQRGLHMPGLHMEVGTRPAELEHPGSSVPKGHG